MNRVEYGEDFDVEEPLRELLRRFTYRPGWTFSIENGDLRVRAEVIDANNQSQAIPLTFARSIPRCVYQEFDWVGWLYEQVLAMERHEAQEFFKIDGRQVYDPHPEQRK